jgi:hypothetical protein
MAAAATAAQVCVGRASALADKAALMSLRTACRELEQSPGRKASSNFYRLECILHGQRLTMPVVFVVLKFQAQFLAMAMN